MLGHTLEDSEGQGSLACCSLWGHKESDMTVIEQQSASWSSHFVFSSPPKLSEHPYDMPLNSFQIDYLSPLCNVFLKFYLVLSFGIYLSVTSFCLTIYWYFLNVGVYALGQTFPTFIEWPQVED